MKRSRDTGTGDSSSQAKKKKGAVATQPSPLVPLDEDIEEVNWHVDKFHGKHITSDVRDQKGRPSCGLHVVLEGTEMEEKRHYALQDLRWLFKLDMKKWTTDFERITESPLELFKGNYLLRALRMAREDGIPVEGSEERLKITGFKYKENMSFNEAVALLMDGRPIIGGFQYDEYFAKLKRKQIYSLNKKKLNNRAGNQAVHHVVLFIGYGVRSRIPYLVFLNSWGVFFCEDGIGRIRFLEVTDFFTITR